MIQVQALYSNHILIFNLLQTHILYELSPGFCNFYRDRKHQGLRLSILTSNLLGFLIKTTLVIYFLLLSYRGYNCQDQGFLNLHTSFSSHETLFHQFSNKLVIYSHKPLDQEREALKGHLAYSQTHN